MIDRKIGDRVRLVDAELGIDMSGWVYERHRSEFTPFNYIYGIRLDESIWARGLCTVVWHEKGDKLKDVPKVTSER